MASKPFQFRQFTVADEACAHKVGTDAVLLGAWASVRPDDRRILDVGTGCGVIALMLAQRTDDAALIDAVEMSPADAAQAQANVSRSRWQHRVRVHQQAFQAFIPEYSYDLIVSNPPFFANSLLPPDTRRAQARHHAELDFDTLISHSQRLLNAKGRLALILPYGEARAFSARATRQGLRCLRRTIVRSRPDAPLLRMLTEWAETGIPAPDEHLILYDAAGARSADYQALTEAFYLRA